jgi:hypothetical protein
MVVPAEAEHSVAFTAKQLAHPARGVTVIDKKRLIGGLFADPSHAALPRHHGLVLVLGYSIHPTQPQPPIRQPFCQALAPPALIDFLLMSGATDALLSLNSLAELLVFRVSFSVCLVPNTPVPPRCHSPIQSIEPPGCRQSTPRADAQAEARRRSKSESAETGFCERHAINSRCRIATH